MKKITYRLTLWVVAGMIAMSGASYSQETANANLTKIAAGQKAKISGVIVKRDADSFVLRDSSGKEVMVELSGATSIKEKKSNPFRGAKTYAPTQLVRGLNVEVEGLGDSDGALAARDIRFTQTQVLVANSVESRVTPVESELASTKVRLTRTEENAQHLSGQVDEVKAMADAARGGAKAAQESADQAIAGVNTANERITTVDKTTNARITAVDDYEVKETAMIQFKLGSAVLSEDAKAKLDQLVAEAKAEKGYVVEVTGFASADGSAAFNRVLSQRRADAVVQYLADNMIPLRRIVTPFGFGTNMPVADNKTKAGRQENRRVEVKILTSKGLVGGEPDGMASIKN